MEVSSNGFDAQDNQPKLKIALDEPVQEMNDAEEAEYGMNAQLVELEKALADQDGAPDYITLEGWKDNHGMIYASTIMAGEDMYVWKTLKRNEYKQIVGSGAAKDESKFDEAIIRKCLLYPKPTLKFIFGTDAGTLPTLRSQVMHRSGFIPENVAMQLINSI